MDRTPTLPRKLFLARAWRKRCPQCGQGELFARYAKLHERCAQCGLVYRREQGGMTGSMYLSAIVTEVFAALLVIVIFFGTDLETGASIAIALPILLLFAYWWLPRSIALWTAIEYATDVANGERWAQPRA
jgi:uncharacterized protein (DUF983 family)